MIWLNVSVSLRHNRNRRAELDAKTRSNIFISAPSHSNMHIGSMFWLNISASFRNNKKKIRQAYSNQILTKIWVLLRYNKNMWAKLQLPKGEVLFMFWLRHTKIDRHIWRHHLPISFIGFRHARTKRACFDSKLHKWLFTPTFIKHKSIPASHAQRAWQAGRGANVCSQ